MKIINFLIKKKLYLSIIFAFIVSIILLCKTLNLYLNTEDLTKKEMFADVIDSNGMQVLIKSDLEYFELKDLVPTNNTDDGFTFSIENISDYDISYYEIRLVNKENNISTIPYKNINYSLFLDNEEETIHNLGIDDTLVYEGSNLKKGETIKLNLKLWIDNNSDKIDGTFYGSLEVTLYENNQSSNYIYYSCENTICPRRTLKLLGITNFIPKTDKEFLGWSLDRKNIIKDINNNNDIILYPIYKES